VPVEGIEDAMEIDAGADHSCALRVDGGVVCWGENSEGQLGDGTTQPRVSAVPVVQVPHALHIATGGQERGGGVLAGHTCAIDTGFYVQCWGRNAEGQLGIGRALDSPQPVTVKGLADDSDPYLGSMTAISAGGSHTCGVDNDGHVACWGDNSLGQLDANREPPFGRAVLTQRFRRFRD
jgi:alpha-tubulin suppressor-like RCC1 family protein